jgi:D-3-phosphoglycerate dehydrogenase
MKILRLNAHSFPLTALERTEYEQLGGQLIVCEAVENADPSLSDAVALAVVSAKVSADLIDKLQACQVIARYGSGTDNVDVPAATAKGIVVTNVPDFCLSEMADHTMALLLGLARKLLIMDRCTRTGAWQARVQQKLTRVYGKKLGLIGFGRIAQAVAERASSFGLEVCAFDPFFDQEVAVRFKVTPASLDEVLRTSDFVSLHLPLAQSTFHLIGEEQFQKMKTSAVLINTARGPVVDEKALVRALSEGQIAGAGLDVYEGLSMFEPAPALLSHPLFGMGNVILTPHCGGCSEESLEELVHKGARQAVSVLRGEWPRHCVNREVVPRRQLLARSDH